MCLHPKPKTLLNEESVQFKLDQRQLDTPVYSPMKHKPSLYSFRQSDVAARNTGFSVKVQSLSQYNDSVPVVQHLR